MEEEKTGFFKRLKNGLSRTNEGLVKKIDRAVLGKKQITDELMEELEEALLSADIGVKTSYDLLELVQEKVRRKELGDADALKNCLKEEILTLLKSDEEKLDMSKVSAPFVIMVIGVNGVGKTTTIGKLASKFKSEGKKVIVGAGDTFRAAAIDQLSIWGERCQIEVVKHQDGADPAAVAYDATEAAKAREADVLILDTAGRLHTKTNLMEELKKLKRVMTKVIPEAPHEVLLVLDAATGQNAISQAKLFNEAIGITGLVVTKLDGTPKGGVIIGIADELKIPIRYIGIGEKVEDLRDFNADEFVEALFD
ncbi:MAG: signal recognition particle-docking protein FtsY [bacterium]|nr:signal recognition particle-docking protein FtsY [bacterium]